MIKELFYNCNIQNQKNTGYAMHRIRFRGQYTYFIEKAGS